MAESKDINRQIFESFKEFYAQTEFREGTGDPSLDIMLRTVKPSIAKIIESLAIPHWFNIGVIKSFFESASADDLTSNIDDILTLPFIRSHHRGYAYHDVTRDNLRRYLARKDPEYYREMCRKFVDIFEQKERVIIEDELIWEQMYLTLSFDEQSALESLDSMIQIARQKRRFNDFESLVHIADEQKMMISKIGKTQIDYYKGLLAFNLRRWEKADKLFQSLDIQDLKKPLATRTHLYRGMSLEMKGSSEEAVSIYNNTLGNLMDSDVNQELDARLHEQLARSYLSLGDLKMAEFHVKKSIKINQERCNNFGEALNYRTLGRIYSKFQDLTDATDAFLESLKHLEIAGKEFEKAQIFSDLATLYSSFARYKDAKNYYDKALEVKVEAGDNYGLAFIYSNLGNLNLKVGNFDTALNHFRSSLEIFKQFKDRLNMAKVLRSIALTHERSEDFESSLNFIRQAVDTLPSSCKLHNSYQYDLHRNEKLLKYSKRPTWKKIVKALSIITLIVLGLILFFYAIEFLL